MIGVDSRYQDYDLIFIHIEQHDYHLKVAPRRHLVEEQGLTSIVHKVIDKLRVVDNMVMVKQQDFTNISYISYLLLGITKQGNLVGKVITVPYIVLGTVIEDTTKDNKVINKAIILA